jgi:hypothetical protein
LNIFLHCCNGCSGSTWLNKYRHNGGTSQIWNWTEPNGNLGPVQFILKPDVNSFLVVLQYHYNIWQYSPINFNEVYIALEQIST